MHDTTVGNMPPGSLRRPYREDQTNWPLSINKKRDWKTQSVLMGQIALRATISTDVFPLVAEMRTQQEKDAARVKGVEQALAQPSVPDSVREAARAAAQQREA